MGYLHQATKEGQGMGPTTGTASPRCSTVSAVLGTDLSHGNKPSLKQCLDTFQQQPGTMPNTQFGWATLLGWERKRIYGQKPWHSSWPCGQRTVPWPILFTSIEVILNTTIHSAQRSSKNGHCLLLGLPQLLQHRGLSFFVSFCSLRYFRRFYLISPVFIIVWADF